MGLDRRPSLIAQLEIPHLPPPRQLSGGKESHLLNQRNDLIGFAP